MKKIYIFSFLLILSASNLLSQSGWFWQNPLPIDVDFENCFFINYETGYAYGGKGNILKTTNSGYSWKYLNAGCVNIISSVFFLNSFTGFAISGDRYYTANNVLLKTTNNGESWNQIFVFNNSQLSCIKFINEITGFIVGGQYWYGGNIFKTTDSGNTWVQYPQLQTNFMNSVYFTSLDTGYIAGDDGKILKTTNCGINWYFLNTGTNNTTGFYDVSFSDSKSGYAVGGGGKIYATTDAGNNWVEQLSNITTGLAFIKFKDVLTGYVTGNSGKILKTTNAGSNWLLLNTNTLYNLRGLQLLDSNKIIVVGHEGELLRSSNAGLNWNSSKSSITTVNINSAHVLSQNKYIAVGDSGRVLITTNAGSNWSVSILPEKSILKSIYFVNENTGYIAGGITVYSPGIMNYSKIYKTTNNGIDWTIIYGLNGEQSILNSIKFASTNVGFACGSGGKIIKTTNSGANWFNQVSGLTNVNAIDFINDTIGVACGQDKIIKTTNGGINWFIISTIDNLNSIKYISSTDIIATATNKILKSTDNGNYWSLLPVNNLNNYYSINFLNNQYGWISSSKGIYKTINGGNNWSVQCNISYYPLNIIMPVNEQICFGFGNYGTILRTTNGGGDPNGITFQNTDIPNNFSLHQNYPNPFNPVTKIKFDIPENVGNGRERSVKIIIYDLLGREVATLVNEQLSPGSYSVDWDGSAFASGVYFYSLIVDDPSTGSGRGYVETKRMVLIK